MPVKLLGAIGATSLSVLSKVSLQSFALLCRVTFTSFHCINHLKSKLRAAMKIAALFCLYPEFETLLQQNSRNIILYLFFSILNYLPFFEITNLSCIIVVVFVQIIIIFRQKFPQSQVLRCN